MTETMQWLAAYVISAGITLGGIALTAMAARDWWNVRDRDTGYRVAGLALFTLLSISPLYYVLMH